MVVYGYAKQFEYSADNAMTIQVRIPSIHGPYLQSDAKGRTIRNYVKDEDLPWYTSLALGQEPYDGDVVVLLSTNDSDINSDFIVIGTTGASYSSQTE